MLTLFDDKADFYEFPNGTRMTVSEIRDSNMYNILFNKTCVIDLVDGILTSYQTLANLAGSYGIQYSTDDEQDPQEVLDKIFEKKKLISENSPVTVSDTVLKAAKFAALSFTDEQAIEVADLYPEYEVDHAYKQNDRFQYNGRLFKVNQNHTSAAQWVPGETGTESLYTNLMLNDAGHQIWKQPTGAHDAYNTGDIVEYKGTLYKSLIDGNVWAPDAYPQGWEVYTEE